MPVRAEVQQPLEALLSPRGSIAVRQGLGVEDLWGQVGAVGPDDGAEIDADLAEDLVVASGGTCFILLALAY